MEIILATDLTFGSSRLAKSVPLLMPGCLPARCMNTPTQKLMMISLQNEFSHVYEKYYYMKRKSPATVNDGAETWYYLYVQIIN